MALTSSVLMGYAAQRLGHDGLLRSILSNFRMLRISKSGTVELVCSFSMLSIFFSCSCKIVYV